MSCFLACFGASKRNNGRINGHKSPPNHPNLGDQLCKTVSVIDVADKEDDLEKRVDLVADSPVKPPEEQLSLVEQVKQPAVVQPSLTEQAKPEEQFSSVTRKKVTFDSNIKEYNPVSVDEENVLDNETGVNQNSIELFKSPSSLSESGSTVSTSGLYPPNHRYQSCRERDDDVEELDDLVSDFDEDEDEDEYEDTLLNSLTPEMKIKGSGFNNSVRDRAGYVHAVMNPIENTSQWRRVKSKGTSTPKEKENFVIGSTFEPKSKNEVVVDASLSNWLVSTHKMPVNKAMPVELELIPSGANVSFHGSNSVVSKERPSLGAPGGTPDEKPLVGTVGVHWNDTTPMEESVSTSSFKGIPNTTSKYREDRKVNWHSTPFEKRLERALNTGSAEAYATHRVYK